MFSGMSVSVQGLKWTDCVRLRSGGKSPSSSHPVRTEDTSASGGWWERRWYAQKHRTMTDVTGPSARSVAF